MRRALFIYGTRPEAIKMAPVIARCRATGALDAIICATAQHRELLDEVHRLFDLRPDFDLGLMRPDQRLPDLTAAAMTAISRVVAEVNPDVALVQGDTTSAMVGALAAFYARVPVAHVEAGLRTGDLAAPFPEEMNRQVIGRLAHWHFAPTARARENLLAEATPASRIQVTGNTAIDALQAVVRADPRGAAASSALAALGVPPLGADERLCLLTAHRRESFGRPFELLFEALRRAVEAAPELRLIYPVHPNPNVRGPAEAILGGHPRIHLVAPLGYRDFVLVLRSAWLVLTDSGGIQEEAPGLGKPVLVLRDVTERPEAVEAGTALTVGTDPGRVLGALTTLRTDPARYAAMATARNPFGDGRAAERIVATLGADLEHMKAPLV